MFGKGQENVDNISDDFDRSLTKEGTRRNDEQASSLAPTDGLQLSQKKTERHPYENITSPNDSRINLTAKSEDVSKSAVGIRHWKKKSD